MRFLCLLLAICFITNFKVSSLPVTYNGQPRCGYQSCHPIKDDMLNVHIISHTHDDVGWLKTVDQYYYGAKKDIQNAGVQYILDSVVDELLLNPERKFIYVETAFFWQWWAEQTEEMRQQVKMLVDEGRLEFIGGGWSMNDEAAADYNDIIDQMSYGLRRLRLLFGECGVPRVAWQIDPFGHSREQASLFAQMGFDGLFVGRIDYEDKENRLQTKTMEMMWNASANIGRAGQIFTGVLYNTYSPPPGFCFDLLCDDEPIMDNPNSADYNVDRRVDDFLKLVERQSKSFTTNNIAMTMGNDFNYQSAKTWFKNLDKLIKYVNLKQQNGSKVNVIYSTPSCYLHSLFESQVSLTVKTDDFFPYASDPHAYWTGYFTSRPGLKGYVRTSNNFLQICKQLHFLSREKGASGDPDQLTIFKESMGIAQHHDAVSGTAKQHVTDDYMKRLYQGTVTCQNVVSDSYKALMALGSETPPQQLFCNALNASTCVISEKNEKFTVTVYNPIGRSIKHDVRVPIQNGEYSVTGPDGKVVENQVVPIPSPVLLLPERECSNASNELVFNAELPAVGFKTFFVEKTGKEKRPSRKMFRHYGSKDITISNSFIQVTVDGGTGLLRNVVNMESKVELPISQNFYWYRGMNGNNSEYDFRASGAYIFRPNGTSPHPIAATASVKVVKGMYFTSSTCNNRVYYKFKTRTGQVVNEIHQQFSDWASQVIRLGENSNYLEFDWLIGPIPESDEVGKEVISVFHTELQTSGVFYTDANGREVLKRTRNERDSYNLNVTEPVAGNYYPVNSRIYIRDEAKKIQVTVLTDRSVGGSSMQDGDVEIMLHRRLLHDDAFGVGEALNEPGYDGKGLTIRGKTVLIVDTIDKSARHRDIAQRLMMAPQVSFTDSTLSYAEWKNLFVTEFSAVKQELPPNVHLLTLEPLTSNLVLLRLEHFYEKTDDPDNLSKSVVVELEDLFNAFTIINVSETNLAANQLLSEVQRLRWTSHTNEIPKIYSNTIAKEENFEGLFSSLDSTTITLSPMQIRTFILRLDVSKAE